MQLKGASYELTIENGYEEACMLIEASRMQAKSAAIASESIDSAEMPNDGAGMEQFNEMLEPIVREQSGN